MPDTEAAAAKIERLPHVPNGTLVYAVGDIHGRVDLLEKMHTAILKDSLDVACERKVVVYLGDYIDRGPHSKKVVDVLLEKPLKGFEPVHLIGNHEAFLIEFLKDIEAGPGWFFNGGLATLASYGIKFGRADELDVATLERIRDDFMKKVPQAHLDFFHKLAFTRTEGDYFFVHAGVRPGVALDNQTDEDMLWIREDFLGSEQDFGKIVVHGHTITWEPDIRPNRIGIDTGAFASGILTALVLEGREQDFLTVTGPV